MRWNPFRRRTEKRSTSSFKNPQNWLINALGLGPSKAGVAVNVDTAMTVSTVYACVKILAESIASLPLKVYRKTADGREEVPEHPAWSLIKDEPNDVQTSFDFREMIQGHLGLRGNAYAFVQRDSYFSPTALIPMDPTKVEVMRVGDFGIAYRYMGKVLSGTDVLHLRGLSSDGLVGISPISVMRESIGLSLATEEHGARLFSNGARPGGVLEHPETLDEETMARLRSQFDSAYAGASNAGKTIVLEEGMKWTTVGLSSDDAQFLETRRFQVEEVARAYRVPLHLLQSTEKSTSWGTGIESLSMAFVTYTLRPWLCRWEQTLNRTLLTEQDKKSGLYFSFSLDGLLRGDQKTRYESYAIGRNWGWLSVNDIRKLENMNDLPDTQGDIYLQPLNMSPAGQFNEPQPQLNSFQ